MSILAVAGIAAAAWHFVRAAFRFQRHGAAWIWTDELARNHARRGDVTALEESRRERAAARRAKRREGLIAAGWLALLAAPSLTTVAEMVYAAYTALWLVPLTQWVKGARR